MSSIDDLNYLENDQLDGKLIFPSDYAEWLHQFDTTVQNYLDVNFRREGKMEAQAEFKANPFLGYNVVFDWAVNVVDPEYNVAKLCNYIKKPEVSNVMIRGMPGSGKTTTGWALLYRLRHDFNPVIVTYYLDEENLPSWIEWKYDFAELDRGDLALADEMTLKFGNRNSGSRKNKEGFENMPTSRHLGAKIMMLMQLSSRTDIQVLQWANLDITKSFSTSAFGEKVVEREFMREDPTRRYLKPRPNYAIPGSLKQDWSIVSQNNFKYLPYIPQPDFMTDSLSRTYMKFLEKAGGNKGLIEELAMAAAELIRANGGSAVDIRQELTPRGFKKPLEFWKLYTGELKKKKNEDDEMSEVDRLG